MEDYLFQIERAAKYIQRTAPSIPHISLFLGTGSDVLLKDCLIDTQIPYSKIPGMNTPSVPTHHRELLFGYLFGVPVAIWTGRLHYYEGHSMQQITFPIRICQWLGIDKLIFTNAAGGINTHYKPGDLVFLQDHIYLFPDNPLRGVHHESLGPRFPDMSDVYQPDWITQGLKICLDHGTSAHRGIYAGLPGPSLETPAEYRYLRSIGADLVGMSTLPEVLVAQQAGMKKAVVSIVSNVVDESGRSPGKTTVASVIRTVQGSEGNIKRLFEVWLKNLN